MSIFGHVYVWTAGTLYSIELDIWTAEPYGVVNAGLLNFIQSPCFVIAQIEMKLVQIFAVTCVRMMLENEKDDRKYKISYRFSSK